MNKRFLVALKGSNGAVEMHPMKDWLRKHPEVLPSGFIVQGRTSHELRRALKKYGWSATESEQEVRLIKPDLAQDSSAVAVLGEASDGDTFEESEEFEFALESHLRDFIAQNITTIQIGDHRLKLYSAEGRDGIEFATDVGRIDILAIDKEGNFFVFELKLARGPDRTMGQLLRYMGWVRKHLANEKQVHGVIVAKSADQELRYAALPVPNVSVMEYEVSFRIKPADL